MTKASRDASVSVEAKHTAPSSDKGLVGHQGTSSGVRQIFHRHGAVGGMVHKVSLMR